MYDLITIGDITVDLYFKGKTLTIENNHFNLEVGSKYATDFFHQGLGGGAGNVAIDASTFELDVAVCAMVGENVFKQIIIQNLVKKNVSTELLQFLPNFVNISSVLLTEEGERTIIHFPTPNAHFSLTDDLINRLKSGKSYYVGHLPNASYDEKLSLIKQIRQDDKPIFISLGIEDCKKGLKIMTPLLQTIDSLIINADELAALLQKEKGLINLSDNVVRHLNLDKQLIIVTDGKNGSYCYHKNEIYFQKAVAVNTIIDTTGVGDAYAASFIASFMKSANIQESMKIASEFASKKLLRLGAN